jgi:mannose-6-phosphate isomerase-like protein (cupin superfamily)
MTSAGVVRRTTRIGLAILWVVLDVFSVRAEIKDVMKSADIDAILARSKQGEQVLHRRPNFSIVAGVREGQALPAETQKDTGTVIHLRKGSGKFTVAGRTYDVAAGDVLHVPRNAPYQIDPGGGRVEYLAIRVRDLGNSTPRGSGIGASQGSAVGAARGATATGAGTARGSATGGAVRQMMPDVIKKAVIDATFAKNTENQPIGSPGTPAYSTNYVIYAGRQPPWETHAGCVDIYVIKAGSGVTQLGGKMSNPKEDTPGEMRGDGVTGARSYSIAVGDVVVIPRLEVHHQEPKMPILGYMLLKVWAD